LSGTDLCKLENSEPFKDLTIKFDFPLIERLIRVRIVNEEQEFWDKFKENYLAYYSLKGLKNVDR